jgi:pilus assembly protein CpaC
MALLGMAVLGMALLGLLSIGLTVSVALPARAQPAEAVEAARSGAAMARGIAATVLAPTRLAPTRLAPTRLASHGLAPRPAPAGTSPATRIAAPPGTATPRRGPAVQSLSLEAGTGRVVVLNAPAASVFAADPRVAEVRPASPTSLFVLGVAAGRTTIAAIGDDGAAIAQYDVTVQPSSYVAAQAQSAIAKQLPGQDIHVATRPNGLLVSGTLPMAAQADQAMQTAREFAGPGQTVESRLAISGSQEVNLRVRIAEVSRTVVRNLGVNWSALGNIGKMASFPALAVNANSAVAPAALSLPPNPILVGANINAVIDALAQDNLAHVLAEPNLTAMSGETASFLVGGEFPIPVAQQNNQVSIEFKQYGVSLAFVPTVLSGGRINLKVRPEVSALTNLGAVSLGIGNSSIQVPALTVRRAETTVELASGQSFAIAGLLQDNTTLGNSGLPGVGELPILGILFRSDAFQRNETELVIVITPFLVNGTSSRDQIKLPTDNWKPPSDLERLLRLRQSASDPNAAGLAARRIPGDAGFVVR